MLANRHVIRHKQANFAASAALLSLLAGWSLASYGGLIAPLFLPTPIAVAQALVTLFQEEHLFNDVGYSLGRIGFAFLLSIVTAVPLGLYLGLSRVGEAFCAPIISFVRYIPASAFVPLFIVWFGVGELQKIYLIFIGVMPYLTIMVYDIIKNTKIGFIEAARTLGATDLQMVWYIIIPQALPSIWDALRLMIGAAWTLLVLAEIVGATSGLGYVIITSQRFLQTANVFAVILIIGLLGYGTDRLFKVGSEKFFPWIND